MSKRFVSRFFRTKVTNPMMNPFCLSCSNSLTRSFPGPVSSILASSFSKKRERTSSSRSSPCSLARETAIPLILMVSLALPVLISFLASSRASYAVIERLNSRSVSSIREIQSLQSPYSVPSKSKMMPFDGRGRSPQGLAFSFGCYCCPELFYELINIRVDFFRGSLQRFLGRRLTLHSQCYDWSGEEWVGKVVACPVNGLVFQERGLHKMPESMAFSFDFDLEESL